MYEQHQRTLEVLEDLRSNLKAGCGSESLVNCDILVHQFKEYLMSENYDNQHLRFLSKNQVSERVGYCGVHIMRLAKASKFPNPVTLGPGRIGFVESEVIEWQLDRIAERDRELEANECQALTTRERKPGKIPEPLGSIPEMKLGEPVSLDTVPTPLKLGKC